jgi:DNA-directed RNA polymerase specialized sigma subunit
MFEDKKEYLNKSRVIYKLICSYEEELLEHRLILQCAPIGCYEQIIKAQNGNKGNLEPAVLKILEYEEKIKETIARYIDIKTKTLDAIENLTDDTEKLVLRLRYLNGKTHEETAQIIGYSVEQEKRIHNSALENFIIPEI